MLKRNLNVISLLVAATSIMSAVPAMAEDVKTVETLDGTVQSAKAYGNGVFLVYGYKADNDDTSIYSATADGKFNKIDGLDSSDFDTQFGDAAKGQYIPVGDYDEKYLDMNNNFKIIEDDLNQTQLDDAAKKLKKKIKKDNDGRFEESFYENTTPQPTQKRPGADSRYPYLDGFSGKWSHYKYKLNDILIGDKLSGKSESTSMIYSDLDGNYVDADYNLGNLTVSTTSASVKIHNTYKTYEIIDDGVTYELKAEVGEVGGNSFLSEGYSDMYRTVNLTIYKKVKGSDDSTYRVVTGDVYFGSGNNKHKVATNGDGSVKVIQNFSKEQASDTIDGIKYPKTSEIYFPTDEDGNSEDVLGLKTGSRYAQPMILSGQKGMTSLFLDITNNKVYAETISLKQKNGYRYIDKSDDDSLDIEQGSSSIAKPSGNLWAVSKGYIYAYDQTKNAFVKQYKVDRSMNKISMSGTNNVIVWNEDKNAYSIIYNKPAAGAAGSATQNTTTGAAVVVGGAAKAGWLKNTDSTWSYIKADGTKFIGWMKDNEKWYYIKSNGVMATGWINDNGTWYYLNISGDMKTGWINDNGNWYYCDASGAMLANTSVDGYTLGNDGAWIK
ncbi:N-acetylmuramoyl-L-alanine amidase family protein [Clostridium chromiireducens]|uniref:Putative endo-beta-N-acetylglucosaminidase n=1 Tax=Clostridium chromiireducens TaxID=225345 RepID=A0A1V4IRF8_9CLOT|nr:N-acetylmuramoyl-L-alanine amidase family protein [Clostridium chromiireducens]OPJ62516.1 putative endo-beta-N-acetylglucosaminidase precursor [Clostridium chromiireducens]